MAGHGSLCQPNDQRLLPGRGSTSPLTRRLVAAGLFWSLLALTHQGRAQTDMDSLDPARIGTSNDLAASTQPVEGELVDAWVEIRWAIAQPSSWRVRIAIESDAPANISQYENYCKSDATTESIVIASDRRQLELSCREKSSDGVLRVRLRGSRSATLVCNTLSTNTDGDSISSDNSTEPVRVSVGELLSGPASLQRTSAAIGETPEATWTFERTLHDALRVDLKRSSRIVPAGESISFSLGINHLEPHAGSDCVLRYILRHVERSEVVAHQSWNVTLNATGSAEPVQVTTAELTEPGVYELRGVVETTDNGIWGKLRRRKETLLDTGVAILVVDSNEAATKETDVAPKEIKSWQVVQTIRPAESRQWTLSGFVPATTDALLATIQPHREATLTTINHAGQSVSSLPPSGIFDFKLATKKAGIPHVITLKYPSASDTRLRLEVRSDTSPNQPLVSFAIREDAIGIDHSPWSTHSFIHYPGSGNESIRLTNLDTTMAASFHSLEITAGPSRLIESATVTTTNDGDPTMVGISLQDFQWVEWLTTDFETRAECADLLSETKSLYRLRIATTRLADFVIASGANTIVLPANQGGRMWFDSDQLSRRYSRPAEHADQLRVVMSSLDRSNVGIIVGLDLTMPILTVEAERRAAPSLKTTPRSSPLRSTRLGRTTQYQPLDDTVARSIDRVVADLVTVCEAHSSFRGLSLNCKSPSHLAPVDRGDQFSPAIIDRFIHSTPDLPQSLSLAETLSSPESQRAFDAWLIAQQRQLIERLASRTEGVVLLRVPQKSISMTSATELCSDTWPARTSNLVAVFEHRRGSFGSLSEQLASSLRLSAISALEPTHNRSLAVAICELDSLGTAASTNLHESVAMDLAKCVERLHPRMVLLDCDVVTNSLSPRLSRSLRAIASAPIGHLERATTSDPSAHPIRIYQNTTDDGVLAVNVAPWATDIEITNQSAGRWVAATTPPDLPDHAFGTSLISLDPSANDTRLAAGEIRWLVPAGGEKSPIVDWTSRPADGEIGLERIKNSVTRVVERLGTFSDPSDYPALANGGFEQSSTVGIVGWLSAQHPPDAVRIDSEAVQGNQSVCLTTDPRTSTRTWLVSETVAAPASGRLAVSMACRGELSELAQDTVNHAATERAPSRLRIAIEGTRRGEAVRYAKEIEVPQDGRWQSRRIVFEVDAIDPLETQSLRLAIDSLTPGRVWIDDVHLHDQFPMESERNDLQGQSFLAVQGLQRGNIAPAARLLKNDWARHLLALNTSPLPPASAVTTPVGTKPTPLTSTDQSRSNTSSSVTTPSVAPGVNDTEPANPAPPSTAERLRSWLPRPLRF